jgi:uncharacterized protein involved in exopolysaccharide biosynthesis
MRETNVLVPVGTGGFDLSARDFVLPLRRRKRALIVTFLVVLAGIILLSLLSGPSYQSHMAILVDLQRFDPVVSTGATSQVVTTSSPVTEEEINSEVELLGSSDVLQQVVIANDLWKPNGFSLMDLLRPGQTREDRIARATKTLAKQIKVKAIKDTNMIDITYKSPDPQRSYAVLKSLGDFYMAKHAAVHRPAGSFQFFATETEKYKNELQQAEQKLRDFGRKNATAAPDEQRTQLASDVAQSVAQLHLAEQSIAADKERIHSDNQQLRATPQRSTTLRASAANDKLISDLNASLFAAETKRDQLEAKYDPSYPLVQSANQEVATARAAIEQAERKQYVAETTDRDPTYELLREDMAKSQADLAAQRATLVATRHSVRSIQQQMVGLDQLALSQQDLQREAKAAESNYLLYLAKREQERTSNALDVTHISNVAVAVPPVIPVLPVLSFPMMVLIAFAAATVLGIGAAYTMDYLDPSFQTPGQMVEMLGIPVVVAMAKKTA